MSAQISTLIWNNFWSVAPPTIWVGLGVGIFLIVFAAMVCLLKLMRAGRRHGSVEVTYVGKPVLSPWEKNVIRTLMDQLPTGLHLCPQVRLADIVKVESVDRAAWRRAFNGIACKSVDFVVMDLASGTPILVIELDDRTHDRPDRQDRDALVNDVLAAACIPLVRFRPSGKLDIRPHLPKPATSMEKKRHTPLEAVRS